MKDLKYFVHKYGARFNISNPETLKQRLRGTPIRGKVYPPPPGFHFYQNESKQWFFDDPEEITPAESARTNFNLDTYKYAGLGRLNIERLEILAKEAVMKNKVISFRIEFHPDGQVKLEDLEQFFDANVIVFRAQLMAHLLYGEEKECKRIFKEYLADSDAPKEEISEAEIWLRGRCLWCGRQKRNPKRPHQKCCGDGFDCKKSFDKWRRNEAKGIQGEDRALLAVNKRLDEIRPAISDIA